jgi:predicted transcriptional regulator
MEGRTMKQLTVEVRKNAQDPALAEFVDAWKKVEGGATVEASDRLYFRDWSTFASLFTPRRVELLEALRQEPADSIRALARRLGRDQKNVHADVQALMTVGLIERDGDQLTAPYTEVGAALTFAA